ncbi:MAG: LuxR C-terminal-related transcriptional regulator [Gordonia sp. (in: high G+C Gram-positive bacteria)]
MTIASSDFSPIPLTPAARTRAATRQSAPRTPTVHRRGECRSGDPRRLHAVPAMPEAAPPAPVLRPTLSRREVEVLLAWLAADSKDEAAARLFIAASTVSTHLARIRAKYSGVGRAAPTKTHLLARALQDGITRLDDW